VVNVFYKHSRIKHYLKDGRAMLDRDRDQTVRIEPQRSIP
jgi:hypothetical protein